MYFGLKDLKLTTPPAIYSLRASQRMNALHLHRPLPVVLQFLFRPILWIKELPRIVLPTSGNFLAFPLLLLEIWCRISRWMWQRHFYPR
ncbi:hypothetical protein M413DRAFT_140414 [Hebeloma cylindrosporum]|uniref:Uncharacterized protein n=1 Tax=Hebeloma cylindrosporum TaxID=76867 RepID=A0A0C2XW50_HEBCY|nr:hypothetical protein M413DRAFT_140414 [Hebeloma cylindrosporum h7]